ncbi:hypothetical protein BOQ63_012410 [Streptomyces viridifaciens]|nr:hypothetical protein CP971_05550 [Streptomyces viridifaciens]UKZ04833.1 hypothetical protein BOQ63_012410 [Streptomyces viridifaciens]
MAVNPLAVHDLAQAVLGCVCAALEAAAAAVDGQPGCPCRACVVPGPLAWDGCNDPCGDATGGQLTVHVARISATSQFPSEDRALQGSRNCAPPTAAVELVVTLLRCAPVMDERGCPPACEELADAARTVNVDMATIHSALLCCLPEAAGGRRGPQFYLGPGRLLEPEGGCMGVEQRVTVALPTCGCPTEEKP